MKVKLYVHLTQGKTQDERLRLAVFLSLCDEPSALTLMLYRQHW